MSYDVDDHHRHALLNALKAAARIRLKMSPSKQLSGLLDHIAASCGYKNWSLFAKDLGQMHPEKFREIRSKYKSEIEDLRESEGLWGSREEAFDQIEEWFRQKYSPLVEFAFRDSESENGYAWPEIEPGDVIPDQFGDDFPAKLIDEVALKLDLEGPWGLEDYGDDVKTTPG
jgi:hypothetical protein